MAVDLDRDAADHEVLDPVFREHAEKRKEIQRPFGRLL